MLLPGVAKRGDELLRLGHVEPEPVPAVALGHRAPERRRRATTHDDRRCRLLHRSRHRLNTLERHEAATLGGAREPRRRVGMAARMKIDGVQSEFHRAISLRVSGCVNVACQRRRSHGRSRDAASSTWASWSPPAKRRARWLAPASIQRWSHSTHPSTGPAYVAWRARIVFAGAA